MLVTLSTNGSAATANVVLMDPQFEGEQLGAPPGTLPRGRINPLGNLGKPSNPPKAYDLWLAIMSTE